MTFRFDVTRICDSIEQELFDFFEELFFTQVFLIDLKTIINRVYLNYGNYY